MILGHVFGFFSIVAVILIWLGITKIRAEEGKRGYLLLAVGAILLVGENLAIVIALIMMSLGFFFIQSKKLQQSSFYVQKQNLLQSLRYHRQPWTPYNMSLWCVIGEFHLDFSLALPEDRQTIIVLQGIIGDVDIYIPEELGVLVESSVIFGQTQVANERDSGLMNRIVWRSSDYEQKDYQVRLVLSFMAGDIHVRTV